MKDAGRIGFIIKGIYDNTAAYEFLDVVYFNNSSYVAKKSTTGNAPAENNEYWQILTKNTQGPKGDTGATGPQGLKGDTGATGPRGPKGDTGPAGSNGAQIYSGTSAPSSSLGANGDVYFQYS